MLSHSVIEFLAGRPLRGVSGSFTVASVCHCMREYEVGALVVVEERQLVGIISERDIATRVITGHRDPMLTLVREVMTRDPQTIAAEASLAEAHRRMLAGGFRHLPVMRGGEVVGMISLRDIPPSWTKPHAGPSKCPPWNDVRSERIPHRESATGSVRGRIPTQLRQIKAPSGRVA